MDELYFEVVIVGAGVGLYTKSEFSFWSGSLENSTTQNHSTVTQWYLLWLKDTNQG